MAESRDRLLDWIGRHLCWFGFHDSDVRLWLLADIQRPSDLRPLYPRKQTYPAVMS